jgi:outer membrane protein assembly factor BamB
MLVLALKTGVTSMTQRFLSTPAVIRGVVYTGADDGFVYALNAMTGEEIWRANAGGVADSSVPVSCLASEVITNRC